MGACIIASLLFCVNISAHSFILNMTRKLQPEMASSGLIYWDSLTFQVISFSSLNWTSFWSTDWNDITDGCRDCPAAPLLHFIVCAHGSVWTGTQTDVLLIFFCFLQLQSLPVNYSDLVVTGDDEGIFGVDAQFLYALKPLDREKQPSYSLQVSNHFLAY